jgi:hypothetical protein
VPVSIDLGHRHKEVEHEVADRVDQHGPDEFPRFNHAFGRYPSQIGGQKLEIFPRGCGLAQQPRLQKDQVSGDLPALQELICLDGI